MINNTILIIGLGNPGKPYEHSPHNACFAVVDTLVVGMRNKELGIKEKKEKLAEVWEGTLENIPVILAKPTTFMNKSGTAVQILTSNFQLPTSHVWLVHDDIDLPLGTLRIVQNRGAAGHKGVQSAIDALGTKNFVRFRVGVRPPDMPEKRSQKLMNSFVTKPYTPAEKKMFEESVAGCAEACIFALQNNIEKTMTKYNSSPRVP